MSELRQDIPRESGVHRRPVDMALAAAPCYFAETWGCQKERGPEVVRLAPRRSGKERARVAKSDRF